MGESKLETAVGFVRLQLGFAQRRFSIAAPDRDENLVPMGGSCSRLQLGGFASGRIHFIEFAFKPENPGQVERWGEGERIQLDCLSRQFLRLGQLAYITENARKQ